MKILFEFCFGLFVVVICIGSSKLDADEPGRIIIAHDVNILSSSIAGNQEAQFAVNAANWLTEEKQQRLLLVESVETNRDFSPVVETA